MTKQLNFLRLLAVFGCTLHFTSADFSLVATDSKTRQVGGVGARCNPGQNVYEIMYVSAPNRSVLHIQGGIGRQYAWHPIYREAKDMMMEGNSTFTETVERMNELDSLSCLYEVDDRQYVMADFESSAAYTGSDFSQLFHYYTEIDDIAMTHGENDRYHSHSAGVLNTVGTVEALQRGFGDNFSPFVFENDDLAGRLMSALWEVFLGYHGDAHCGEAYGTSASGAYLHIDNPDGTTLLHINIVQDFMDSQDPLINVADAFLEWRFANVSSNVEWTFENFPTRNETFDPSDYEFDDEDFFLTPLEILALIFLSIFCVCAHWFKYCYKS